MKEKCVYGVKNTSFYEGVRLLPCWTCLVLNRCVVPGQNKTSHRASHFTNTRNTIQLKYMYWTKSKIGQIVLICSGCSVISLCLVLRWIYIRSGVVGGHAPCAVPSDPIFQKQIYGTRYKPGDLTRVGVVYWNFAVHILGSAVPTPVYGVARTCCRSTHFFTPAPVLHDEERQAGAGASVGGLQWGRLGPSIQGSFNPAGCCLPRGDPSALPPLPSRWSVRLSYWYTKGQIVRSVCLLHQYNILHLLHRHEPAQLAWPC